MRVMVGKGGTHYHRLNCRVVDKSSFVTPQYYDYYEVELDDVKSGKIVNKHGEKYRACPMCFDIEYLKREEWGVKKR